MVILIPKETQNTCSFPGGGGGGSGSPDPLPPPPTSLWISKEGGWGVQYLRRCGVGMGCGGGHTYSKRNQNTCSFPGGGGEGGCGSPDPLPPNHSMDHTGPRSAVGNVSGYRYVSDCRSRGREFDHGPVPYFRGDWSWNNIYCHSPPFRWFIQEGLLSVTSESMCTNYWLTACSSLPRKSVVRWTDHPAMTLAVDLGRKATKQTNKLSMDSEIKIIGRNDRYAQIYGCSVAAIWYH